MSYTKVKVCFGKLKKIPFFAHLGFDVQQKGKKLLMIEVPISQSKMNEGSTSIMILPIFSSFWLECKTENGSRSVTICPR